MSEMTPEQFEALRAENAALRAENDSLKQPLPVQPETGPTAPTHNVLLADGSMIDGSTIGTHHVREDGVAVPVVAAYLKEAAL